MRHLFQVTIETIASKTSWNTTWPFLEAFILHQLDIKQVASSVYPLDLLEGGSCCLLPWGS